MDSAGCVSSPILKAFVMKVSEVEAEFHRGISELLRGVAVSTVSLPSNETKGQEEWRVVSSGAKRRKILKAPQRVETKNSFAVLEGVEEEKEKAEGDKVRRVEESPPTDKILSAGKILVIGDSQVRHLNMAFCDKDRERRTRLCLPGAGIEGVNAQLDMCLVDGTKPIVFLSEGGNDICKVRSEELFRRFKEALAKIGNKDATHVVCGVLPRRGLGGEWLSRAIAINCRLADHCRSNGWVFIDNWDLFYSKDTL
ncbi:hypothetical protein E2C01_039507 [Portunus trituberculatus]|uniref:SGNH hydrolase-type esterase domain-containing protein n=1 Tax=Portunus trituberculatus TaxID=210409 RepID=A0A5B7FH06_PORTR|nr:hypothetical protein [Portunus trituberculatus]